MPIKPLTIDAEHMGIRSMRGKYMGLGRWVAEVESTHGTKLYLTWGPAHADDRENSYNSTYSPSDMRRVIFNL